MKQTAHRYAGFLALSCILTFWISTIFSELMGNPQAIAKVKTMILYGMAVLVPSLMTTAGSGFSLAGSNKGRLVSNKKIRMPLIALNGLFILVPSAVFLWWKASHQDFDTAFMIVQATEILAGAVNIILISLNIRDGLKLSRMLKRRMSA